MMIYDLEYIVFLWYENYGERATANKCSSNKL